MQTKNVFIVTRMFSGLFESIQNNEWAPTGIPTITKLVEQLSSEYSVHWIVSCKNEIESQIVDHKICDFTFENFTMRVIPYKQYVASGKFNLFVNSLVTFSHCRKLSAAIQPKFFYCDRSNILTAALLKRLFDAPVFVRILGVYPDQKMLALRFFSKFVSFLTYLSYKTKFDLVVCTQDGSGVEFFLGKLLNPKTPREILLNGVKRKKFVGTVPGFSISDGPVTLLFVGKLIEDKGIIELIEAVVLLKQKTKNFKLTVIGKGGLESLARRRVREKSLDDFVYFAGSVSQADIYDYYDQADVYISLNKLGNLSNTVLEAMTCGKCVVMLGKDEATHTDEYTEQFVPADIAIRIDRENIVENLSEQLSRLCCSRPVIKEYADKMYYFARQELWSWEERIEHEISLLTSVNGSDNKRFFS